MSTMRPKLKLSSKYYWLVLSSVIMSSAAAQNEDGELESIAPAARVQAINDKFGDDFVHKVKDANRLSEVSSTVSKAVSDKWVSTPAVKSAELVGDDVSEYLSIEEVAEPVGIYRYSSAGKSDPFVPPYEFQNDVRIEGMEIPIVSPLQVSLGTLRVSGLWQLDDGTRKALIMTEKGEGIITGIGDPIGLSGKIIDIQDHGVITRQYRIRSDGSREFEDVTLAFGTPKKEPSGQIILAPGKEPVLYDPSANQPKENILPPPSVATAPNATSSASKDDQSTATTVENAAMSQAEKSNSMTRESTTENSTAIEKVSGNTHERSTP